MNKNYLQQPKYRGLVLFSLLTLVVIFAILIYCKSMNKLPVNDFLLWGFLASSILLLIGTIVIGYCDYKNFIEIYNKMNYENKKCKIK